MVEFKYKILRWRVEKSAIYIFSVDFSKTNESEMNDKEIYGQSSNVHISTSGLFQFKTPWKSMLWNSVTFWAGQTDIKIAEVHPKHNQT